MANVKPEQADTYKCFAANEFGRAVVTVVLNVIEGKRPDENVFCGKRGSVNLRLALFSHYF